MDHDHALPSRSTSEEILAPRASRADLDSSPRTRQRPHKPDELGPRIFKRGRWYAADLRPWDGERVTLRNPSARHWPKKGERTDDPEVADRWKWKYVDLYRDAAKRRNLGGRPRAKPLGDSVTQFLAQRELTVEPLTVRCDESTLRVHIIPRFGDGRDIETIETAEIQAFFDELVRLDYKPSTLERMCNSFGAFFAWAGAPDHENPARKVVLPAVIMDDVRPFTDDEMALLREKADWMDKRARLWTNQVTTPLPIRRSIELGFSTGGRCAELLALDWSAFREGDRTVRYTVQVRREGTGVKHLKGKMARTTLVLPDWWAHHDRRARGRVLDLGRLDGAMLNQAQKWMRRLYRRAGITNIHQTWHALRHTYARRFLELGGRLEELQKSLGHKSITTTEEQYGHFSEDAAAILARRRIYGEPTAARRRTHGRP